MSQTEAKGPKLPYFHRSLTPQDAALIGDTTPKPISESPSAAVTASGKLTTSSAWNGAQTWEERNTTSWCKEKLAAIIPGGAGINGSNYAVSLTALTKTEGHAQITHSRGKARFMYEWTLTVDFEALSGGNTYKGSVVFSDVINDLLDDIETEVSWTGKKPVHAETKIVQDLLKRLIISKMRTFEEEYRKIDAV
eukprot:gene5857-6450_t